MNLLFLFLINVNFTKDFYYKKDWYDFSAYQALKFFERRFAEAVKIKELKFKLATEQDINAFARNQEVTIFYGLINNVDSVEEFLGVLAHECSHIKLHHTKFYQIIEKNNTTNVMVLASLLFPALILPTLVRKIAVLSKTVKDNEIAADLGAFLILQNMQLPTWGLKSFFDKMWQKTANHNQLKEIEVLVTHPLSPQRKKMLENLEKEKQDFATPDEFSNNFEILKESLDFTQNKLAKNLTNYGKILDLCKKNQQDKAALVWQQFVGPEVVKYFLATKIWPQQAPQFYQKILKIIPDDGYILLQLAKILITKKSEKIKTIGLLDLATMDSHITIYPEFWYEASVVYKKLGLPGDAFLALAERELILGNLAESKKYCKKSLRLLSKKRKIKAQDFVKKIKNLE